MGADNVIEIEGLYKEYRLGVIGHGTLYQDLQSWWARVRDREDPNSLIGNDGAPAAGTSILALRDANLEVGRGEVLGVIGANGAGKSTLLKILSRVTAPTRGVIRVAGRIASLLEVGTGFHGELTGRENIYLNGAINGLSKREVSDRLDEIVDFAKVEQFLDTPVKRYSSGMYVKLGFAVAAHLNPDILVVDEVLAVGDAAFQKKAIGKMQAVSREEGRTVLFVSHNMESIRNLCTRAVLLEAGSVVNSGVVDEVIDDYLVRATDKAAQHSGERTWEPGAEPSGAALQMTAIRTRGADGRIGANFDITEPFDLEVEYRVVQEGHQLSVSVEFLDVKGVGLFIAHDDYVRGPWGRQAAKAPGLYRACFKIPANLFNPGVIVISLTIYTPPSPSNQAYQVQEREVFSFNMTDSMAEAGARGSFPYYWGVPVLRPQVDCVSTIIAAEAAGPTA